MQNKYIIEYRHLSSNSLINRYISKLPLKEVPILTIDYLVNIINEHRTILNWTDKDSVCEALKGKPGVIVLNIKE